MFVSSVSFLIEKKGINGIPNGFKLHLYDFAAFKNNIFFKYGSFIFG